MDEHEPYHRTVSVRTRIRWLSVLTLVAAVMIGAKWIWGSSLLQVMGGTLGVLCVSGWYALLREHEARRRRHQ